LERIVQEIAWGYIMKLLRWISLHTNIAYIYIYHYAIITYIHTTSHIYKHQYYQRIQSTYIWFVQHIDIIVQTTLYGVGVVSMIASKWYNGWMIHAPCMYIIMLITTIHGIIRKSTWSESKLVRMIVRGFREGMYTNALVWVLHQVMTYTRR